MCASPFMRVYVYVRRELISGVCAVGMTSQHTHTVVLPCCWSRTGTLDDCFWLFPALRFISDVLSAFLRRAFLANGAEDGEPSAVLLLLGILMTPPSPCPRAELSVRAESEEGGSPLESVGDGGGGVVKGSEWYIAYKLLLPDRPSLRSRMGRGSQTPEGLFTSGTCCRG